MKNKKNGKIKTILIATLMLTVTISSFISATGSDFIDRLNERLSETDETFDVASWRLTAIVQNNGIVTEIVKILDLVEGDAHLEDTDITPNVHDESMGAWKLQLSTGDGEFCIKAKGENGKTIRWHADLHATELHNTTQSDYN